MGWYSVIGYFCRLVLLGSKGNTWGLSVRQYFQEGEGIEMVIITPLIWEITVCNRNYRIFSFFFQWAPRLQTLSRKCGLIDWTSSLHVTRDLNHRTTHPSRRLRSPIEPFLPSPHPLGGTGRLPQWHIEPEAQWTTNPLSAPLPPLLGRQGVCPAPVCRGSPACTLTWSSPNDERSPAP